MFSFFISAFKHRFVFVLLMVIIILPHAKFMQITLRFMQKADATETVSCFRIYEPGMSEIHTARFHSAAAGLRILTNFVFVSVILSE